MGGNHNGADWHFLIDNAPPVEVEYVLRCLSRDVAYSTEELRHRLLTDWGYKAQRNLTLSTRRLFDLGLATRHGTALGIPGYLLTQAGAELRSVLALDHRLYSELMHFLHYDRYDDSPSCRKLFWSYRLCCDIAWDAKKIPLTQQLVTVVLSHMAAEFPEAYGRGVGGNFNAGGVSAWKTWLAQLDPRPFDSDSRTVLPRQSERFELVLLSLDHLLRRRVYRYGDPVLLDKGALDDLARVFFLDPTCCRSLLDLAARLTNAVELSDTFAGAAVTLVAPYGIERISGL